MFATRTTKVERSTLDRTVQRPPQFRSEAATAPTLAASSSCQPDFSRIPIHTSTAGVIQAKLAINEPGDEYEQEADRVAERVTQAPEPQLQRACACGGSCSGCQTEARGHQRLQMNEVGSSDLSQAAIPPSVHEVLRSTGQPLDSATRSFMEPRCGHDFSHVRVHSGAKAEQSAGEVNAHAYTVGHDIVFGAGRFAPRTQEGQRLLAHELTHVVQQSDANGFRIGHRQEASLSVLSPVAPYAIDKKSATTVQLKPSPRSCAVRERAGSCRVSETDATRTAGPKPIALLGSDYSSPEVCGGRKCFSDDEIYAALDKSRAEARQHDEELVNARTRNMFRMPRGGDIERILGLASLGDAGLDNIDAALKKVTQGNNQLLRAYYSYYAEHTLSGDLDKGLGDTSNGDTEINPEVLALRPRSKDTEDPLSLLGGTLIHEFVHTSQGGGGDVVGTAPMEAKAHGVEYFFAERMGDQKRMDVIFKRYDRSKPDPIDQVMNGQAIFWTSYKTMRALYEVIEKGEASWPSITGLTSDEARNMAVDFISNASYGPQLRALIQEVTR